MNFNAYNKLTRKQKINLASHPDFLSKEIKLVGSDQSSYPAFLLKFLCFVEKKVYSLGQCPWPQQSVFLCNVLEYDFCLAATEKLGLDRTTYELYVGRAIKTIQRLLFSQRVTTLDILLRHATQDYCMIEQKANYFRLYLIARWIRETEIEDTDSSASSSSVPEQSL